MYGFRRDAFGALLTDLDQMQREFNRVFDRAAYRQAAGPRVNVWEDDANVYAETDLPGVPADAVELSVSNGSELTIKAERKAPDVEGATWHRQERPWGEFSRALRLPVLIDAAKVEATFTDGVLRVTLPKSEAVKPRKITLKA